jgi:hypothetical protein
MPPPTAGFEARMVSGALPRSTQLTTASNNPCGCRPDPPPQWPTPGARSRTAAAHRHALARARVGRGILEPEPYERIASYHAWCDPGRSAPPSLGPGPGRARLMAPLPAEMASRRSFRPSRRPGWNHRSVSSRWVIEHAAEPAFEWSLCHVRAPFLTAVPKLPRAFQDSSDRTAAPGRHLL